MKKRYYISSILVLIFLYKNVFGAFYFSEILPYTDDDVNKEYIQITYDGNGINNLDGYILSDKSDKEYIFSNDEFLAGENKKYYRPETKILLNNSDEEIYLKDNSGSLIDSFYYANSQIGELITIEKDKTLIEETITDIDSSSGNILEETGTGDILFEEIVENDFSYLDTSSGSFADENIDQEEESFSGELLQEENLSNTGSLSDDISNEETSSGTIQEDIQIEQKINIDIKNIFQSPSYLLEKDINLSDGFTYNCDRTKDDCRVNFDLRSTFLSLKESDFNCLIDFGLGGITGEENKCNPNTIIFPIGITNVKIKISHKTNINHNSEINIKIKNEGKQIQTSSSSIIYYNQSTNITEKIDILEPKIQLQSGLEKDNTCNKKECKINFLYEKTNNDLICNWDFGEDIDGDGNENKCNPGYVYFGPGKHEIFLEICDKNNDYNCKKSSFSFENIYEIIEPKSIISIQGKITKNKILGDKKISCINSKNCSINFDGSESIGEEINYFWDFGNGEYFEGKNPKSIVFDIGNYQTILEIYDEYGNYSQDFFEVEVIGEQEDILIANQEQISLDNQNLNGLDENQIYSLKIDLQGKLSSNKILNQNKITCIKTCSINFDGSKSIGDFSSYFWDFGNGETYIGKNPPYISYKDYGNYSVIFSGETKTGELLEQEFQVEFIKSIPKVEEIKTGIIISDDFENKDDENYDIYEEDLVNEDNSNKTNKDFIISIFIFLFLCFILGLFVLKKYKLI